MEDSGPHQTSVEETYEFAYAQARRVLSEAKRNARRDYRSEASKRRRIVGAVAIAWLVLSIALVAVAGNDMMVAAEIGCIAVVAFAVFYLMPIVRNSGNLEEVFSLYDKQIDRLEALGAPLPVAASVEELVAGIDVASTTVKEQ